MDQISANQMSGSVTLHQPWPVASAYSAYGVDFQVQEIESARVARDLVPISIDQVSTSEMRTDVAKPRLAATVVPVENNELVRILARTRLPSISRTK